MPPKAQQGGSKKAETKAKQKIIEDKTFGLKNKNKSSKVSKYIQQVETQVKQAGRRKDPEADAKALQRERKKAEEAKKAELAALFKPVVQVQKVPPGVDPKTVVCTYFKSGQCTKGDKCKFSHDLAVERKSAKISLYEDRRDEGATTDGAGESVRPEDTMQDWDQSKLEQVVQRKHQGKGVRTTTDIVCKFFLEAIEKKTYGWFWDCPNGGDQCKYRHALPPGFVLKNSVAGGGAKKDESEQISLEEFLEIERYRIEKKTPVTAETFLKWKAERRSKAEVEERTREREKEAQIKAGKMLHASGRDLFTYNPDMFMAADDEEAMDVDYTRREEEEGEGMEGYEQDDDHQVDDELDESAFLEEDLENLEIDEDDDDDTGSDDGGVNKETRDADGNRD